MKTENTLFKNTNKHLIFMKYFRKLFVTEK